MQVEKMHQLKVTSHKLIQTLLDRVQNYSGKSTNFLSMENLEKNLKDCIYLSLHK